jgi:membrane protein implicated in regulation of membrane protease activity
MPTFIEFVGLPWFWASLGLVFLCAEIIFGGAAFFLALASATAVPALMTAVFSSLAALDGVALFAAALVPATFLWGRSRRRRVLSRQPDGSDTLNNRGAGLIGATGAAEKDFPYGKGWVTINGLLWPCESAEGLRSADMVCVTGIDGILLKVVKLGDGDSITAS